MKRKIILVTATIILCIYLMSQLLNELNNLHIEVMRLHSQVEQLQDRQQTLIESNKVQDKLIEEVLMEIHKPKPISEQKQVKDVKPDVPQVNNPPLPLILGAVEGVKKWIFGW